MMSKYTKLMLLSLTILTLGACSSHKKTEGSGETSKELSTKVSESSNESQISSNSTDKSGEIEAEKAHSGQVKTMDKGVSYNGSYYSIKGKYDEIVIVNKHYPLSPNYNPGEDATAKSELLKLIAAMRAQGYAISDQYSGFRSYETQVGLYQSYVNQDGQAAADRYSARPGYSEHQSGLAFDLIDSSGNLVQEAGASQWLLDNAHKYGFVVRYPVGKESSTGYMPESWHLRYVGKEAKEIAESGLSLEEYYGFTGGNYVD